MDSVVNELPSRCVPCLLGDINAKVGQEPVGNGVLAVTDSSCIGPWNPEVQNENGHKFHEFLQRHYMSAVNTFHNAGPTYFGIVAGYTSRIDHICLPSCLLGRVQRCCVWHKTGDNLQLVAAPGKRDHRPLQVVVDHTLALAAPPATHDAPHWDTDRLMRGVLWGENRTRFVKQLEAKCDKLLHSFEWQQAAAAAAPDDSWNLLRDLVLQEARPHFQKQRAHQTDRPADTAAALQYQHECKLQVQRLARPRRRSWNSADVSLQQVAELLHHWGALARYYRAQRVAKRLTTRDKRNMLCRQVAQFEAGWTMCNFRQLWQSARQLSGRRVGPKQRRFDRPRSCQPSIQDWCDYTLQPGPQGGCEAQATRHTPGTSEWQTRSVLDWQWRTRMQDLADADFARVAREIWRGKTRRSAPPWTVPNEVWRTLFYPNYHARPGRSGLGFEEEQISTPYFSACVQRLFLQIRCASSAPIEWHCSNGVQIDKKNGKPLCQGLRVINVLDPLGKHFFSNFVETRQAPVFA